MSAHIHAQPCSSVISPFEQSFGLLFAHCFGSPFGPHVDHVGLLEDHVGPLEDHAGPPVKHVRPVEEHLGGPLRMPLGTLTIVLGQ